MRVLFGAAAALIVACAHEAPPPATPPPATQPPVSAPPGFPPPGTKVVVVLRLRIDATGRVVEASVIESAGQPYDDKAVAAMRAAKFKPAENADGTSIKSVIRWRVVFETDP